MGLMGSHRQTFGRARGPHAARHRPPRAALDLLDLRLPRAVRAARRAERRRLRDRQGQRPHRRHRAHRPRRPDRAARRRRARLAARARRRLPAARRPALARARGAPARRRRRPGDLDRPPLRARRLRLELPRAATSCASASARSTRASTSRTRPSMLAEDLERDAVRYQGNWIPHRLRDATEDGVFFVGDSAGHCLPLTAEGIRTALLLRHRLRPRAARRGRGPQHARARRSRATATSPPRTSGSSSGCCARSGSCRACRRACWPPALRAMQSRRFVDWSFGHYLEIAPPEFVGSRTAAARHARAPCARRLRSARRGTARATRAPATAPPARPRRRSARSPSAGSNAPSAAKKMNSEHDRRAAPRGQCTRPVAVLNVRHATPSDDCARVPTPARPGTCRRQQRDAEHARQRDRRSSRPSTPSRSITTDSVSWPAIVAAVTPPAPRCAP